MVFFTLHLPPQKPQVIDAPKGRPISKSLRHHLRSRLVATVEEDGAALAAELAAAAAAAVAAAEAAGGAGAATPAAAAEAKQEIVCQREVQEERTKESE